ncbi:MAG TPA: TetR family transcriptional regulator C-terminal domain-containing protein [Woeseiaceae bacterium]
MIARPTRQRLLETGMAMLLERGYHDLGVQAVLTEAEVPKGSFYHHFRSKEEFGIACIDLYMEAVHEGLDQCLQDPATPPLQRIRNFFEGTAEKYRGQGYLGCLLGGLGQELSGVSETFRAKVEECFGVIASRLAQCLAEARDEGALAPETDPQQLAELLVNCWEGAALRCRLARSPAPLHAMLDFYFAAAAPR